MQYGVNPDALSKVVNGVTQTYVQHYPNANYVSGVFHHAKLEGLLPLTTYYYRCSPICFIYNMRSCCRPPPVSLHRVQHTAVINAPEARDAIVRDVEVYLRGATLNSCRIVLRFLCQCHYLSSCAVRWHSKQLVSWTIIYLGQDSRMTFNKRRRVDISVRALPHGLTGGDGHAGGKLA